MLLMNINNIF